MTATDELRRLLDERGVEYTFVPEDAYSREYIKVGNIEIRTNGRGEVAVYYLTPEQAVEATLGRGTCHDANNRFDAWTCSECGATMLLMFDDFGEPTFSVDGTADVPHYCPNCGRRLAGEA